MNQVQQSVSRILGNGQGGRTDLSNFRVERPKTQEALSRIRENAHNAGPGSDEYVAYMAILQQGLDEGLPSATGGVPRSIDATGRLLNEAAARTTEYFVSTPDLLNASGWNGVSFAQHGPEASRQIVAEQMAMALPHERAQWQAVAQALDNATTSTLGIQYQTDEGEILQYDIPSGAAGDPSGYQQHLEARGVRGEGLNALKLQMQDDSAFDGLRDYGAGGGTFDAYAATQLAALRSGQSTQQEGDFYQSDANTFED